jgi:integrase
MTQAMNLRMFFGVAWLLDDDEEVKLWAKIYESHPEQEPEFDLALHTGMRRGEQYGLRWQEVDFKRGIITIPRSKLGEVRHIQINSVARSALQTPAPQLRQSAGDGWSAATSGPSAPGHKRIETTLRFRI